MAAHPVAHLQANRRELAKSSGAPQSAEHVLMSPVRPSATGSARPYTLVVDRPGRWRRRPVAISLRFGAWAAVAANVGRAEDIAQVRRLWRRPYPRLDRRVQAAVMYSTPFGELDTEPVTSRGGENTWPRRMTVARTPRRTGVSVSSRPLESAAAPAGDRCRRRLQSGSPARA